tara:strand:- start:520 stop:957 length:438 start_codon:yes stop_codon:yes gene_type:complete
MKTFFLNFGVGLLFFFTPIQGLVIAVGIAVILDTFTGIYKTIKIKGWRSIRSRQLSNIISKMVLYEICIIALFPIDKFLLNELLFQLVSIHHFATKIACVAITLVEITSIKENIEEALKIDIWKTLKNFIKRAKEVSNNYDEIKN